MIGEPAGKRGLWCGEQGTEIGKIVSYLTVAAQPVSSYMHAIHKMARSSSVLGYAESEKEPAYCSARHPTDTLAQSKIRCFQRSNPILAPP